MTLSRRAFSSPGASGPDDLLVYGAGHLGRLIGERWLRAHPNARVVGVTSTDESHAELVALGLEVRKVDELGTDKFSRVVFAVPPSKANMYHKSIEFALSCWSPSVRPRQSSDSFVFTSSGGVLAEDESGVVDESSPVSDSLRARVLLDAERQVTEAQGTVLRFAGLYDANRGAHAYWLTQQFVNNDPGGLINQLHYSDAAAAVEKALDASSVGEVFLVGDGSPLTRRAIVDAALASRPFKGFDEPRFTGAEARPTGKIFNTSRFSERFGWTPIHVSFSNYMRNL